MSGRRQKFLANKGVDVYNSSTAPEVRSAPAPVRAKSPIKYILEQQKFRTRQDIATLRIAIDTAENIANPNRELLHRTYREIIRDPNLSAQWESRKMKTKTKEFKVVNATGEEVPDKTELFRAPWFMDWMDAFLDRKLWGFRLVEFGDWDGTQFVKYKVGNKFYDAVNVIQPDNVKPEFGLVTSIPGAVEGISMDDPAFADTLMFMGKMHDFGLLFKCAKYILFKDNCLGNWSEWAEVFGMDKRVGYTNAIDDPATGANDRTNFIKAIRDLGSNAYGVFGETDKVEYIGTQRTDAFEVYNQLISYIDAQVSKIIFGQDVVSNETGKLKGTVGENMANMYGDADAREVMFFVNNRIIPFLQQHGVKFEAGEKWVWDSTEKLSLKDRILQDKAISDMGFQHPADYINETYGTEVTEKKEDDVAGANEMIRKAYGK